MTTLLIQGDARRIPLADQSVSLVFGSPPYVNCRVYLEDGKDLGIARDLESWVAWMLAVTTEALRVSRGAVVWVAAGKTEGRNYWPACEMLMADWYRRGGSMYRPCYWHRVGIPGSGGDQWFRADVEYVLCFKRPGKLPWTDNLACGSPPKFAPGGRMSHRIANGSRINDKYSTVDTLNIIQRFVDATQADPAQVLQGLQEAIGSQTVRPWFSGILERLRESELLQPGLRGRGAGRGPEGEAGGCQGKDSGSQDYTQSDMRDMRLDASATRSSPGRESPEQRPGESPGSLPGMPQQGTCEAFASVYDLRADESFVGAVRKALPVFQETWESFDGENQSIQRSQTGVRPRKVMTRQHAGMHNQDQYYSPPDVANPGNLIHTHAGGGHTGPQIALDGNEAPFPESLAEHFILSLCPPGGSVLDSFSGSGTTASVAERHGRVGIGIDLRRSQCLLGARRIADGLKPVSKLDARPFKHADAHPTLF